MKRVVLLRKAKADLAAARRWYEQERRGYGQKFLDRVAEAIESIGRSPESHQLVEGSDSRIHLVRGFPYIVLYRVEPKRAVVFAVIHGHRDPETWPSA